MKKRIGIGFIVIMLASILVAWFSISYITQPPEAGFRIVSLENNALLISDADVLSYNWTSQEIAITDAASERLFGMGDSLYNFTSGFAVRINGEEIYRGVFRTAVMSAVPSPPRISALFPSMLFPSQTENRNAIRMFYPGFEPPSDLPEANARIFEYFEDTGKLNT